jgi:RhtB (resistance to homoserine/threonine) family protein
MDGVQVYILQWLTLVAVFGLAVISPGPDFVVAVRNSVVYSRRAGMFTALGFGVGILFHVAYTLLGLAVVISQSILMFGVIKYAGAAYLAYIGFQALRSRGAGQEAVDAAIGQDRALNAMSGFAAFKSGLLTNALNPKATLFFLAIFSQIINPETPLAWKAVYGLTCGAMVSGWFCLVSFVLTHARVRAAFLSAAKWMDRSCGVLLIALGAKVALSEK